MRKPCVMRHFINSFHEVKIICLETEILHISQVMYKYFVQNTTEI